MSEIDRIFDLVDRLCWESNWDEIDRLLQEADTETVMTFRISWLTITRCVKSKLKYRETFYENTEKMLTDDDRKEKLLGGLE